MSDLFLPTLSLLFDYHSSFSFKSETRYSNFHLFVFIPFAFSSFVRKCCFLINLKLLLDDCFFPFLACRSLIAFGSLQSVPLMFPFVSDNGRRRCVLEESVYYFNCFYSFLLIVFLVYYLDCFFLSYFYFIHCFVFSAYVTDSFFLSLFSRDLPFLFSLSFFVYYFDCFFLSFFLSFFSHGLSLLLFSVPSPVDIFLSHPPVRRLTFIHSETVRSYQQTFFHSTFLEYFLLFRAFSFSFSYHLAVCFHFIFHCVFLPFRCLPFILIHSLATFFFVFFLFF
ncbi:unnamed protein product [Acanthosepion pharaonis]|uniref:Uncharacterized protein n=1 Tax=Acanthosepion pharaonis TaxID=158019 RepID=A0A812CGH7_ACAPH|nr:unnamed protein product [Sepia pharaonis]